MRKLLKSLTAALLVVWPTTSAMAATVINPGPYHFSGRSEACDRHGRDDLSGMVADLERINRADLDQR